VEDVAEEDIRAALVKLLANRDASKITMRTLRPEVAKSLGLAEDALESRAEELQRLAISVVSLLGKKMGSPHGVDEALGEERPCVKMVYNVTFPAPQLTTLKAPGELSRAQIRDAILGAVASQNSAKSSLLHIMSLAEMLALH
jgi:hypothetical protein